MKLYSTKVKLIELYAGDIHFLIKLTLIGVLFTITHCNSSVWNSFKALLLHEVKTQYVHFILHVKLLSYTLEDS